MKIIRKIYIKQHSDDVLRCQDVLSVVRKWIKSVRLVAFS